MVNLLSKIALREGPRVGSRVMAMTSSSGSSNSKRDFSVNAARPAQKKYELLVLGGGAGGCSTASRFVSKLGKGKVAVVEPADMHYYQPMWTLVGGGQKTVEKSGKPMADVLPKGADWIKASAVNIDPEKCVVTADNGDEISYEYLVIGVGLTLHYEKIKGLVDALETPGVGSNYSRHHVEKTWKAIQNFPCGGNAVFTLPAGPVKCAGAPQKIMYLTERILTKEGKHAHIDYHSALPVLFGVKKYADALWKMLEDREKINVNLRSNLVEVDPDRRTASFENLDRPEEAHRVVPYDMLHVTPPMAAPAFLRDSGKGLTDETGFVDVDKFTLQHKKYANVFGVGDSANVPTSKTAAAVAGQMVVLSKNLSSVMANQAPKAAYDGYTSCPLVTGPGECILAEFDFSAPPEPLETFPFDQAKPRWTMYNMKAHAMPHVYWQMLAGRWGGPKPVRKLMHLGMSR